jgi:hypothetical protein
MVVGVLSFINISKYFVHFYIFNFTKNPNERVIVIVCLIHNVLNGRNQLTTNSKRKTKVVMN